ncbi:L,D-transpeptidase [Ferruginibacter sp.]
MKSYKIIITAIVICLTCSYCNQQQPATPEVKNTVVKPPKKRIAPSNVNYHFEKAKQWMRSHTGAAVNIAEAVNRMDSSHLAKADSILVPGDLGGDIEFYLPFPLAVPSLKNIDKILVFSYPAQSFAAYEAGELVYAGPTNMGRKSDPTPPGLYYTNWKAEETTSTFNDEWNLRWNFNIENKLGIGFHQYELPGYPASHSCLRLTEKDARFLYSWADQWILKNDSLLAKGTPVIVFGQYDFAAAKPWLQLAADPHALDISTSLMDKETAAFIPGILQEQQKRAAITAGAK